VVPEVEVGALVDALVGLIEQQQARPAKQGEGKAEFLPGTAGKVTHQGAGLERDPERGEQLAAFGRCLSAAAGEQREVLGGGEQVEQRRLLRAVPGAGATVDGPGVRGLQPGADPQQGGLAGPVLAGDCHDLPRVSLQADVAENGPAAVGLA